MMGETDAFDGIAAPPPSCMPCSACPPSASAAELKAAYRTLAKRHHPDVGGDAKRILALNAAWAVLGDREKRRRYDAERGRVAGQGAAVVRPARARARP